ncbi:ABC transporter permease subunit [Actinospica robiniae]|uniref:ABC transporter permease subunit n=1 Tax=Actinospica robiniae TaxID=304901 RepID=UPI000407FFA4|nr:ABC transporter permease subunit [Actinospica robiniae]
MSEIVETVPAAPDGANADTNFRTSGPAPRATFPEAMDSEFAKLRTVRSTWWTLVASLIASAGISFLIAVVRSVNWNSLPASQRASLDMYSVVSGVYFGVLVTGVLGVLVVATEYTTGMMRTALTAFPRRGTLFAAKALVLAGVVLVLGLIIAFASYGLAEPFYARHGLQLSLTHEANLRAVLAVPVYLVLVALMGLAFGFLLRHTAGAISSLMGLMFVIPIITNFLPGTIGKNINKVMPSNAGGAMITTTRLSIDGNPHLTPLGGLITLLIWVAALTVPALLLFRRRDA